MSGSKNRPGEIAVEPDPAATATDAGLVFIGRIRSPWRSRESCPKNIRKARETGKGATIEIDAPWRPGLVDIEPGMALVILTWMHQARRDLVIQAPRHSARVHGVFSIRSPVRPNPIGLGVVRCLAVDRQNGIVSIDAIDALDGTPLIDIKPWLETTDIPPLI
ncbi:MAG: tRNA (N6-threonylcarbamoyladenosine(37)-N6)-methyltransferase TrmO [Parvibaculaceae bacterium]